MFDVLLDRRGNGGRWPVSSARFKVGVYSPTAKTDREGNFELRFVRPGRHAVLGGKMNDNEKTPTLSPVINVSAGETTNIGEVLSNERH